MVPPWKPGAKRQSEREVDVHPRAGRHVRRLRPYRTVSSLERIDPHSTPEPMKLDWNESTLPPSPLVIERIQAFLGNTHHINWYPDQNARELTERLVSYTDMDADSILVTSGSDAALDLICQTYLEVGDEVVVPSPTYTHFLVYAGARGASVRQVYGSSPFELDIDAIMNALSHRTKVVYLVSPTNPTGVTYPAAVVARIARAVPQALVVVDEAYYEFSGVSAVELVETYSNVVVTRTFSKSFGIAGLRIGYLMAQPAIIRDLRRIFNPKSVNVLGQVAACAALDDLEYLYSYVDEVNAAKQELIEWLTARNIRVVDTPGNFLMIQLRHPHRFIEYCEEENIFIRNRSMERQLERFVRMNVGTRVQTADLIDRLTRVLERMPHLA
jgi:histidinol-phosphate aminotransferase